MNKSKKALWISLISVDAALTVFLFVVSIIMLATMPNTTQRKIIESRGPQNMIEYFQLNPLVYFFVGVLPLILLLIANIIGLVVYIRKLTAKKQAALSDLSEEEKAALKAELLKDLNQEDK